MWNSIISVVTAIFLCLFLLAPSFGQQSTQTTTEKNEDSAIAQVQKNKNLLEINNQSKNKESVQKEAAAAQDKLEKKTNSDLEASDSIVSKKQQSSGNLDNTNEDSNGDGNEAASEETNQVESTEQEETESDDQEVAQKKSRTTEKKKKTETNPEKKTTRKRRHYQKSFDDYVADAKDWCVTIGLQVLLIMVVTLIAIKFTNGLAKQIFNFVTRDKEGTELLKRATTLSTVVRYLLIIALLAIGGMMILNKLGVDIGPLLAGAGVLGIAVGFGAQSLVKDIISGAFILMEDQIRVGDVVELGTKRGTVEKVTLRMVVLRDVSGNVHFIPSGDIQTVTNMTKTFSRYLFDIGVAYKEDTDAVIEEIKYVDEQMREDENFKEFILSPIEIMGVQRFEASAVIIRARIKTQPGKQWRTGREYNRRFKKRFDEVGIEIPYPHLTVYPGVAKDGVTPPLNIEMTEKS